MRAHTQARAHTPRQHKGNGGDKSLFNHMVSECTSLDELQQATEPLTDYLANAGCLRPLKGIEDKDLLVEDILMFQVVHRVSGAFERFV